MQIFKVISTTFGHASANQVVVDEVEAKEDLQTVCEQELVSSRLGHSVEFDVAVVPEREPTQTAEGKHDDEVGRHAVNLKE